MAERITMEYTDIIQVLPHRPPLLLVDRVLDLRLGESILAIKCVSGLDPYFAGHFPNQPMFPGVYLIEGIAQASAILCFQTFAAKGQGGKTNQCVLTGVEGARLRKPVVPGDVLHYFCKLEKSRSNFVWVSGVARVNDEIVAETKITAMIGNPLVRKE